MKEEKNKLIQKLQPRNFLARQYFVLLFFWIIFIALLMTALILFLNERMTINNEKGVAGILNDIANANNDAEKTSLYKKLMDIYYPLIDFSLMSFVFTQNNDIAISDWRAAWSQRTNNTNTTYSYIFITILIALIFYIVFIIKLYQKRTFQKNID